MINITDESSKALLWQDLSSSVLTRLGDEAASLEALAKAMICEIDWAQFKLRAPSYVAEGHHVLAVGDLPVHAAEALAASLDRPVQYFETARSAARWVKRVTPRSVLVFGAADLPARFAVERLDLPCGFLPFSRPEDAWPVVIGAVLMNRLASRSSSDVVLVPPSDRSAVEVIGTAVWVTGAVPGIDYDHLVGAPKRVFGLVTHSDGVSAFLGPVNFCVSESAYVTGDSELGPAPICLNDGFCYRFRKARSEARATKLLIAPERLRADVFLNFSCWGSHFGSVIHPARSLRHGFSRSMSLRAQITTTSVLPVDTELIALGLNQLAAGRSVGECALALNRHAAPAIAKQVRSDQPLFGAEGG